MKRKKELKGNTDTALQLAVSSWQGSAGRGEKSVVAGTPFSQKEDRYSVDNLLGLGSKSYGLAQ